MNNLETSLGAYPSLDEPDWCPDWDPQDVQNMIEDVPDHPDDHPDIWSDGSTEPIPHLDVEVAGAGSLPMPLLASLSRAGLRWTIRMLFTYFPPSMGYCNQSKGRNIGVSFFVSRPFSDIHVGIENLNVLWRVARLLEQANMGTHLLFRMVTSLPPFTLCSEKGLVGRSGRTTSLVMMELILQPISGCLDYIMVLSALGVPSFAQEIIGIPSWLIFTNS